MKTKILDCIDFEKVNTLLEGFNQSTGFVTAILDLEGNILSKSGWRHICVDFHRVNSDTSQRCKISDTVLAGKLAKGEKYHFYKCLNGLVDVAVPIIIKDEHIANLFSGQFFFEKPDISFFKEQAAKFGFNEASYLKSLGEVPVISEEKVKTIMEFLLNMTQVISDMTFQKMELMELNDSLRISEERYRLVLENTLDAILLTSPDGSILAANRAACDMFQYSEEEICKRGRDGVVNLNDPRLNVLIEERNRTGKAKGELLMVRKDGTNFPVEITTSVFTDQDGNLRSSMIIRDITERKITEEQLIIAKEKAERSELQLKEKAIEIEAQNEEYRQINEELYIAKEKAEESDRLKTAFLQNMSHEIRTPMNAIMGFSELLAHNYNNKTKLEYFSGIITQRCNDLLDIINDLLDIAKIESGQLPVKNELCNINILFAELGTFFTEYQKRQRKQHISLNILLGSPLNIRISTDIGKLKQIFINLISNAFKFTNEGSIEVSYRVESSQLITFYISDTGIGIPADKQHMIFDRFTQLEQGANRLYGGTGLGLSIVKGLIRLLGGKIWLESEPGKGTTFYFTIPLTVDDLSETMQNAAIATSVNYNFKGKTILIVEDDEFNAEYIKEILSNTGISLLMANYGNEAIQIAVTQSPDLILMDIGLPDISGYDVVRQIKKQKNNLKIIAQTAYAADEDRSQAIDAGCDDYISKPLKHELLLSMIDKHLSTRSSN